MARKLLACAGVALIVCLAGCGENADQRAARATVNRFYNALKAHDAGTACRLVSPGVAEGLLRSSGEGGQPCVPGLKTVFRKVSHSPNPDLFDVTPHVQSVSVTGNRAVVVISGGYQRRHLDLIRKGGRWRIIGSPDIR